MRSNALAVDSVLQTVRALYSELHHAEPAPQLIALGSNLDTDLGFDSLARVELLLRLEQHFQVHVPETTLEDVRTVSDLLRAVQAAARGGAPSTPTPVPREAVLPQLAARAESGPPAQASTLLEVLAWRVEHDAAASHLILLGDPAPVPLSFGALRDSAALVARGLRRRGIGNGSTVALMLPTGLDFFSAFLGVMMAGAIPVPIYPPARASQLEEHVRRHALILANAGAEGLITLPQAHTVALLLRVRVPSLRSVWSVPELSLAGAEPAALPAPGADSVAMLQYTSGSTGAPKGVVLEHRHLLANIRTMGGQIGASSADVFVSWLPLYHDMGLIGAWLSSLYFGCPLVIMPPTAFLTRPSRWLRAIHDHRATLSAAPNFGYELAARRIPDSELAGLDLSCWRIAFNGAEPVSPDTIARFEQRFEPYGFRSQAMTPVYGLAEAAVGVSFPPPGRGPRIDCVDRSQLMRAGRAVPVSAETVNAQRFVSSGLPLHGYQVRIIDASGAELPERVEGDLQFCGPSATEGYYRNAEATERLKRGAWRDTGDRAYLAGGEIFITGRSKDIIIRRGRHIYPEEVEHVVGELPGVRRGCVAAFGATEPQTATEKLILVAETHALATEQRTALLTSINERVVGCIGEPPDEVLLVPPHSVLKTSSGKLRRAATRESYEHGSLHRPLAGSARQIWRLGVQSLWPLIRNGLRTAARVAFGLYAWATLIMLTLPVLLATALLRSQERAWRLTHHAILWLLALWRIPLTVQSEPGIDLSKPHIVVLNHCSYVDSLIVGALLATPHCFVAKAELRQWPLLQMFFDRLGTIFIERTGPQASGTALQQIEQGLVAGRSLIIYPEGTFTRATGLRGFHLGAFEAAVACGVPVIPVALRGTRSLLRDGQILPRRVPVAAMIGKPLRPAAGGDAFGATVQLRDAARAHILRYCGEPDLPEELLL